MKNPLLFVASPLRKASGFTLIELMVSVTIGLILLLFLSSLYFNSSSSSRLNDDNARIQEDGRYALGIIGTNMMQAGFGNMQTGTATDFPPGAYPSLKGLTGCNHGFVLPAATPPVCDASSTTAPAAFTTSYTSEPHYDATNISGAGTDCSGTQAINSTSTTGGIVINSFYVSANTLYCKGNAGATPLAMLSNVDDMQITYGIDNSPTSGLYAPVQSTQDAAVAGDISNPNANTKIGWDRVVTATVCLEIHSTNAVVKNSAGQTYYKCNATSPTTKTDGLLHTTMTRTFTLRNNATASLIN